MAELISAAVTSLVSAEVVAVRAGDPFVKVSVKEPPVASLGTVKTGDDHVAVPAEIEVQLVPEAAGVPPGVPMAAVMFEAGKATDCMG